MKTYSRNKTKHNFMEMVYTLHKKDETNFTEQDMLDFSEKFIALVEEHDYLAGGGANLVFDEGEDK